MKAIQIAVPKIIISGKLGSVSNIGSKYVHIFAKKTYTNQKTYIVEKLSKTSIYSKPK